MKIYFAGADGNSLYTNILKKAGVTCKLESYYSLGKKEPASDFENYLLDSGGYVARTRNIIIRVEDYADFIKQHDVKLVFNLDTNDQQETLANQEYLQKNTNAYVIPIFHMSDWIVHDDLLDKLIAEGYPYIGLGGAAGVNGKKSTILKFYEYCFAKTRDKIKLHGLGATSRKILEKFPFYSVDSTSWLSTARYGNSISPDKVMTFMKAKQRSYLENTLEETVRWLEVEKYINQLWQKRGVNWN
jgi:hypothetical protein